jgi:hypothetical protein
MARAETVFVSLQDPQAGPTAAARHRASGVLLAADLVAVPALGRSLVEQVGRYEVLLVPVEQGRADGRLAERIRVAWADAHTWGSGEALVLIRLGRRSRLPVARPQPATSDQLRDGLARHDGDFWAVLHDHGLPTANRDTDPAAVLAGLPTVAAPLPGPPPVQVFNYRAAGDAGVGVCDLVPWCAVPSPPIAVQQSDHAADAH